MIFENKCETLQCKDRNQPNTIPDGFTMLNTIILLTFPSWLRGGSLRELLTPYYYLAVFTLFFFLLAPYFRKISHLHGCTLVRQQIQEILHDPIFYIGSLFICQLYIQWWNSGKVRILLEEASRKTTYSPPYIDWLPGAVDPGNSWDMLVWFFPAFVALLIMRLGFHWPRMVRILFWGMVINASLLAIFGIIVPLVVKHYPMWLTPILPRQTRFFFSTFGYPNHAGSFFILHLGLACGLFCYYSKRKEKNRSLLKSTILLALILLIFLAVHLTRCRYAILFCWLIIFSFLLYWLVIVWKSSGKQGKMKFMAITAIALVVFFSFSLYLGTKEDFTSKLSAMSKPGKFIAEQWDLKFWQTKAAAKMWLDYPLFGVGGRGYRHYLLKYVKNPEKRYSAKNYKGMAYVHNDLMQFLCEFGIVGTGLLLTVFILLAIKIAVSKKKKQGFFLFGLLGLLGVLIHSLIDLPFRSPPVIIAFIVILAGYGTLCQSRRQGRDTASAEKPALTRGRMKWSIHFYTILFLFISIVSWWAFFPIRQQVSGNIVRNVEKKYYAKLTTARNDKITPGKSQNASPELLRSLWWAKLLYADNKDLRLLSASINFDLYRKTKANNDKIAGSYLKEAFRSSLAARRYTNYADVHFIKLHTAILDALGYYLEESWCLLNLRKAYPDNIRINLLVREYYSRRPHLYR